MHEPATLGTAAIDANIRHACWCIGRPNLPELFKRHLCMRHGAAGSRTHINVYQTTQILEASKRREIKVFSQSHMAQLAIGF